LSTEEELTLLQLEQGALGLYSIHQELIALRPEKECKFQEKKITPKLNLIFINHPAVLALG